jgi:hypothetical protein
VTALNPPKCQCHSSTTQNIHEQLSLSISYKTLLPLQQRIKDVESSLKAPSDGRMQTVD